MKKMRTNVVEDKMRNIYERRLCRFCSREGGFLAAISILRNNAQDIPNKTAHFRALR